MFFMRYPIDGVPGWRRRVTRTVAGLRPWQVVVGARARDLELPVGAIAAAMPKRATGSRSAARLTTPVGTRCGWLNAAAVQGMRQVRLEVVVPPNSNQQRAALDEQSWSAGAHPAFLLAFAGATDLRAPAGRRRSRSAVQCASTWQQQRNATVRDRRAARSCRLVTSSCFLRHGDPRR
jgi:hypothetical protein